MTLAYMHARAQIPLAYMHARTQIDACIILVCSLMNTWVAIMMVLSQSPSLSQTLSLSLSPHTKKIVDRTRLVT